MGSFLLSTNCKLKSLTTHKKYGKYLVMSLSVLLLVSTPLVGMLLDFICMFLLKFTTKDKFSIAVSSILPTLL